MASKRTGFPPWSAARRDGEAGGSGRGSSRRMLRCPTRSPSQWTWRKRKTPRLKRRTPTPKTRRRNRRHRPNAIKGSQRGRAEYFCKDKASPRPASLVTKRAADLLCLYFFVGRELLRAAARGCAVLRLTEVCGEQLLGAVSAGCVLVLGLAEELRQLLVTLLLGVGDVECHGLG